MRSPRTPSPTGFLVSPRAPTLRPWFQAFWWTNDQIRSSIAAAEDLGVRWIMWNMRTNFDASALPTDAEVSSLIHSA